MTILAMLGTTNYQATEYQWEGNAHTTQFFTAALANWYPDAAVKVLATEEAKAKHWEALCAQLPRAEAIDIPSGKNEDELWAMFNTVAESLPMNETVIFDVTHGFRSLPLLTLLALSFLRVAKNITLKRVFYGAWEARSDANVSPVFDLTPFVAMLDWANATSRFTETGDARKFKTLIKENRYNPLNEVESKMVALSESLAFSQAGDIWNTAKELGKKVAIAKDKMPATEPRHSRQTPFLLLLDRVAEGYAPMASPDILTAQWNQIGWFLRHDRHPEALSLAREWLVSVRVIKEGGVLFPVEDEQRKAAETWLNSPNKAVAEEWILINHCWLEVGDFRNYVQHFGLRKSYKPNDTLRKMGEALPEKLRLAVLPLGIVVGEAEPGNAPHEAEGTA